MTNSPELWAESLLRDFNVRQFRSALIEWGREHGRGFPWRQTRDPFRILVSEVLLHRTRAEQVVPLFHALLVAYPSAEDLSRAPEGDLHALLRSAGLRWRVDLLRAMAQQLVVRFGGEVPVRAEDLQSLPGIGPYISGAVRCFAYGEAAAILDTNTVRILGRVFGLAVTDSSRRSRRFHELMQRLVDPGRPREFNYALLDLGALVCRPGEPLHTFCPVADQCSAAQQHVAPADA